MVISRPGMRVDFKRIMFLTDFSEPSCEALPFAMAIARGYGSRICAVHILVPSPYDYMSPEAAVNLLDSQEEWAKSEMARVEAQLTGLPREVVIERDGNLWDGVARVAQEHSIDLIVLGTHGRTGLKKVLLGSSAEEVFRRAHVPVLLSGPNVRVGAHTAGRFRCVLFATDFNSASKLAAPYAVSLAQENQAKLILLHVLPQPKPGKAPKPGELSVAEAMHQLTELIPQNNDLWCRPLPLIAHGHAAEQILATAEEQGADLIALGVRATGALGRTATRVQRDIAYEVLAHSTCPVLTVRDDAPAEFSLPLGEKETMHDH
ncbi:MAG TPA: universal stress protein [Candidatus Acidoferrum sp.]|nr:universal stress protein [Candidatus Acidoferrum sp.]